MTNIRKWFLIIFTINHIRDSDFIEIPNDSFPNQDKLPHPCRTFYTHSQWADAADQFHNEGDIKNDFYGQLQQNNFIWTESFCEMDSDGDGVTNGEEVGDPFCKWRSGRDNIIQPAKSHPGVCEPVNSDRCLDINKEIKSRCYHAACPFIYKPDVKSIVLAKRPTKVPLLNNSFTCETFDLQDYGLDMNKTYHVIATEPIKNKSGHLHHSLFLSCGSERIGDYETFSTKSCFANLKFDCQLLPFLYEEKLCFSSNVGIPFGKDGAKSLTLEAHWKNLRNSPNIIDTSELKVYYTENLRKHSVGLLWLTNGNFVIPPLQPTYEVLNTCSSSCTSKMLKTKVYVRKMRNHMHTFGIYSKTEQYRKGILVRVINEETYNWLNVTSISFKEPIEILPGDEIKVHCVYSTQGVDKAVKYGDHVHNEMCMVFLEVYPIQSVTGYICSPELC